MFASWLPLRTACERGVVMVEIVADDCSQAVERAPWHTGTRTLPPCQPQLAVSALAFGAAGSTACVAGDDFESVWVSNGAWWQPTAS